MIALLPLLQGVKFLVCFLLSVVGITFKTKSLGPRMSGDKNKPLQCYNKGCGKQYDPDDNHSEACTFHPGAPFFHDAYKGWSCCNKKCTDFTEFLNIKGCTRGSHNNVKPPAPEKQKSNSADKDEVVEYMAPTPVKQEIMERPSEDSPMIHLPVTITPSLQQILDKQKTTTPTEIQTKGQGDDSSVVVGTSCKNAGCKQIYEGDHTNLGTCIYHTGVPIFHEGLKYWSCCQRKTTDFNNFLDQEGCQTGSHSWMKPESDSIKKSVCRYDWHQTGSLVVLSIYAKGADPARSYIEASPVKVHMVIAFGENIFEEEIVLCGIIDVEKSSVSMAATKVEVKLRKAEFFSWNKVGTPKAITNENQSEN